MKTQRSTSNLLLIPRIILTLSIVAISVVSYCLITHTSNVLQLSSKIGKITGNQRTLCSQIVNSIAADNIGGKLEGPPIDKTLAKFVKSQSTFLKVDSMLSIYLSKRDLSHGSAYLHQMYKNFMRNISANIGSDSTDKFVDLLSAQDDYLLALDGYASALNVHATAEAQTFKTKETTILGVSLIIVFLEIVFLFLPAIKRIKKQNEALVIMNDELQENHKLMESHVTEIKEKNEVLKKIAHIQSHEVRHPLSSIMALVNLANEGHPVDEEWLRMMQEASQSLDARIRSIVKESQTEKELRVVRYDKMVEDIEEYAIILLDAKGRIDIWNKGAENVFGYKDFEVTGKNFSMFYSEANRKATHIYYLLEEATGKGFVKDESVHMRKDGSAFYASTLLTAIHNDDTGELAGFTTIVQRLSGAGNDQHAKKTSA